MTLRVKNNALYVVLMVSLVVLALVLFVPGLRDTIFHFDLVSVLDVLWFIGSGLVSAVLFECFKWWKRCNARKAALAKPAELSPTAAAPVSKETGSTAVAAV